MKAMRRFAEGTAVEVSSSQEQIKRLVSAHGATGFLLAEGTNEAGLLQAMVQFRVNGRMLKYERSYPDKKEMPKGKDRWRVPNEAAVLRWRDAEWRRRWRSLHLIIKAKLEVVASGDTTFDREFLADIMLPDGSTMGQKAVPAIAAAYETGTMPQLMPGTP